MEPDTDMMLSEKNYIIIRQISVQLTHTLLRGFHMHMTKMTPLRGIKNVAKLAIHVHIISLLAKQLRKVSPVKRFFPFTAA